MSPERAVRPIAERWRASRVHECRFGRRRERKVSEREVFVVILSLDMRDLFNADTKSVTVSVSGVKISYRVTNTVI